MTLTPIFVAGSAVGLQNDIKPFMLTDQAFSRLDNAYVYRERVKKRQGLRLLARLRRLMTGISLGTTSAGVLTYSFNLFTTASIPEVAPSIEPGSVVITIGAPDTATFTDNGNGTFTVAEAGVEAGSFINYSTGAVTIVITASTGGSAITAAFNYFPNLPVMGSDERELASINDEQEVYFDTTYAYIFVGTGFQEFIPGTIWAATNSDFFWSTNFRGITPDIRLFFVTDFVNNTANPIRYTDGITWTNFAPFVSNTPQSTASQLWQAELIIPYYGRLLALNTWEGVSQGASVNFFNRCRFSRIGDPTDQATAWRSDIFGTGGFIDAPTDEAIISCSFFKNTLIVDFERSTWNLRYIGDYGLPFVWERISSDFGGQSKNGTVTFDNGNLKIGDKAITASTSNSVQRVDPQIPDFVFNIATALNGNLRIGGIRDFQKELVYWTYQSAEHVSSSNLYPNRVLVYNYRNNTYAIFRDNVTSFGTFQPSGAITWDSTTITWDDSEITWDDAIENALFPFITAGNQQGWVHYYNDKSPDDPSLEIAAITLGTPIQLTINSHNLEEDDFILLNGVNFLDSTTHLPLITSLNGQIYIVNSIIDVNNITILQWNGINYSTPAFTPLASVNPLYIGGATVALLPVMYIQTKDFNPYQSKGLQTKLSYIDFLTDATPSAAISVQVFTNSSISTEANLLIGNYEVETSLTMSGQIKGATNANPCLLSISNNSLKTGNDILIQNVEGMTQLNGNIYSVTWIDINTIAINVDSTAFGTYIRNGTWIAEQSATYIPDSDYAWHRFFISSYGQYFRIVITYDDTLMNNIDTHTQLFTLNAFSLYVRPGGKLVF